MAEDLIFGLIAKEDLNLGYGTFGPVPLPDGTSATLNKVNPVPFIDVKASPYNVKGDGTDDTAALQALLNTLTSTGGLVFFPRTNPGYDITGSLLITGSNIWLIGAPGAKITNSTNALVADAMIVANFSGTSQASNIVIAGLELVGGSSTTNCFKRGIRLNNVTKSAIRNCKISGVDVPPAGPGDAYGVFCEDLVTLTSVEGNTVSFATAGATTDAGFRIGVLLKSPVVDGENGQVSGLSPLPQTTTDITVSGNFVYRGTHAYDCFNVANVCLSANHAKQQIRNLIVFATNKNITVTGNSLSAAASTNMTFDYGNIGLTVTGNTCDTTTGGEGNAIEMYYNNSHATISGNTLLNFATNGVLIAYKADNIAVVGNTIYSATASVTGIHVIGALGPNYTNVLTSPDVKNITIKSNRVKVPTATSNGIRVLSKETASVLDPVNVTEVVVDGNDVACTGGYGVTFIKNGGTGTFTPLMGDSNVLAVTTGFADGPFGSDYNVYRVERRSAIPGNGAWAVGSLAYNTVPAISGNVGWVCITAGTPGTWVAFGTPIKGQAYSPSWAQPSGTQPAIGNGSLTGLWTQIGSLVTVQIKWTAGGTTTYGNNLTAYRFSVPVACGSLVASQFGVAYITDVSAGSTVSTYEAFIGSGETSIGIFDMAGGVVRQLSPITFSTTDHIEIVMTYDVT